MAETSPETHVISACEREADDFELFTELQRNPVVELVVRAQHNRRLADGGRMFETVGSADIRTRLTLAFDRQSARTGTSKRQGRISRQTHTAELPLRPCPVAIGGAPAGTDQPVTLPLTVVHAVELEPPAGGGTN